ncbi:MAG TPA: hypothetical protein PLS10_09285 [Chitinophagales bacterium]|nr:hypothetical protein [Chitinophagales bacterium]
MTKEQILAPFYKQNKGGLEEWIDYSDALDVMDIYAAQEKEKEAVEFADFIHENCIKALDGKFIYNTEQLTTAELYKIFKTESNGNQ